MNHAGNTDSGCCVSFSHFGIKMAEVAGWYLTMKSLLSLTKESALSSGKCRVFKKVFKQGSEMIRKFTWAAEGSMDHKETP